ncbi:MAG: ADP-ribosylglycohydrolase family protein [Clostridia bacterium]|nr:ADP-ribosylglycohydrolase family protein [Clostridia bacterium]
MYGAIIGDIVGSRFEFKNHRSKEFELFTKDNFFTDDTVMTCAVADALINKKDIVKNLQSYGRIFRGRGYGGMFYRWLYEDNPKPYYSFGNGAAMRVSSVGWIAKSEKEVKKLCKKVTEITHNHPEGLKGAEVTAMCIFYARQGYSKDQIREYVEKQYSKIKDLDYKKLKLNYRFNETCQDTVPEAIYCFLISTDFEDCLRTSISVGGDSDTLAAISCSIAEAFYGIPKEIKIGIKRYFNLKDRNYLLEPIEKIYNKL